MAGEATIPASEQGATPGGEGTITSAKPTGASAPPESKVAELETEVGRLKNELEQQKTLQSQADRKSRVAEIERKKLEKQLKAIRSGETFVPPEVPEGETPIERETRLEAKIGIQQLILDNSDYQNLVKQDITLREVLKNNPFALIGGFFDAQDAVEQIREKLDTMVSSKTTVEKPKEGKGGAEFEVGAVQPASVPPLAPKPAQTSPYTDTIAESIRSKIKFE